MVLSKYKILLLALAFLTFFIVVYFKITGCYKEFKVYSSVLGYYILFAPALFYLVRTKMIIYILLFMIIVNFVSLGLILW